MSGGASSSSVKRKRDHPGDTRPDTKTPKRTSEPRTYSQTTRVAPCVWGSGLAFTDLLASCPPVFPIFEKRKAGEEAADEENKKPFRWLTPLLGPTRSCLHGVHLAPTTSARVAAFDLDGTVIKSSYVEVGWRRAGGGGGGGKQQQRRVVKKRQANGLEWEWWRAVVPQKLKEAHDSGCALILFFSLSSAQNFLYLKYPNILLTPQVLCRVDIEPVPQALGASRMEEKDPTDCCCRACRVVHVAFLLSMPDISSCPLGTRTPVSNICGHGERWAPEAHAWDVVRTRADFCPRRNHDR
jgi:Polynucleotide kinase 3 phosphatase